MSEIITNGLVVTLSNGGNSINNSATSITVAYLSGGTGSIPAVSSQTMRCYWDGEIITVTATSGGGNVTWTIVRGAESSTAISHADLSVIYQVSTVAGFQQYIADQIIANLAAGTGISLSVASNTVTIANTALKLISSSVLGAATNTVTFSSIPGTFNNLRIVSVVRSSQASGLDNYEMQFNGDTASHYNCNVLINSQSGAVSGNPQGSTTFILVGQIPAATQTAGLAGYVDIDIPAYALTTFDKMVKVRFSGTNSNLSWDWESSAVWQSTAAITSITLFATGGNFIIGSAFYLYGY